MKMIKPGIIVLTVAVLSVVTAGVASAATYKGEFATTLAADNSVVKRYSSYGNLPGSDPNGLTWYNSFNNRLPREMSVTVTQNTSPANGLEFTRSIVDMSLAVDPDDLLGIGVGNNPVTCKVMESGSHTIYATHIYSDLGTSYTSPVESHMTFYDDGGPQKVENEQPVPTSVPDAPTITPAPTNSTPGTPSPVVSASPDPSQSSGFDLMTMIALIGLVLAGSLGYSAMRKK